MAGTLDKIDFKILQALQKDASRSAAEIAEVVGLSQSPCWRRIQRLKAEGYISKVVAILDRHKLGLKAHLFVQIKVERNDQVNLAEFSKAMRSFPEVLECHVTFGTYNFLLRVVAKDMDAYEKFYFERLSRVPNILEVNSAVVVSEIKQTTALPLPHRNITEDGEPLRAAASSIANDVSTNVSTTNPAMANPVVANSAATSPPRLHVSHAAQPAADLRMLHRELAATAVPV